MYRELIIVIIILVFIIVGEKITQNYTDKNINGMINDLQQLKDSISVNDKDNKEYVEKCNSIYEEWNRMYKKLAYYIEHDELEKVEAEFVTGKSYIESEQYDMVDAQFVRTIFILDHIVDKYSLTLENIF